MAAPEVSVTAKDTAVILAAAGRSSRYLASAGDGDADRSTSKIFRSLLGREVWRHSVDRFRQVPRVGPIYIAISPEMLGGFQSAEADYLRANDVRPVAGGHERYASVRNALRAIEADAADGRIARPRVVAVHDAARPCVTIPAIEITIDAAEERGAAIGAVPLWGTIKRADAAGRIIDTVPRENLYQATTPQAFRYEVLLDGYADANIESAGTAITDDAQLVSLAGHPVHICVDNATNLKVTTAGDMLLAELILRAWAGESPRE